MNTKGIPSEIFYRVEIASKKFTNDTKVKGPLNIVVDKVKKFENHWSRAFHEQ